MGEANSKNVAQAVTDVSNYIQSSTVANTSQVNSVNKAITFTNCDVDVGGNFSVDEVSKMMVTNKQITNAIQNADVKNDVAQKMVQAAQSTVGFLGLGYAGASNESNEMINSTSQIVQDVTETATQYSYTGDSFECSDSYIKVDGNFDISFDSTNDFVSSQVLNQTQTATIVNNLSQSVDQKATATVEGISSLLFGLLLILAVIIYAISKPLSSGSAKIAIGLLLTSILVLIGARMYVNNDPPLFSDPPTCIKNSALHDPKYPCANYTTQTIELQTPPQRYVNNLLPLPGSGSGNYNLLQMAIAGQKGTNIDNGGYRMDVKVALDGILATSGKYGPLLAEMGLSPVVNGPRQLVIPNPLMAFPDNSTDPPICYTIPALFCKSMSSQVTGAVSCTPGIVQYSATPPPPPPGLQSLCAKIQTLPVGTCTDPTTACGATCVANVNTDEWNKWINTGDTESKARLARYILADLAGISELNIYVNENDPVLSYSEEKGHLVPMLAKNSTAGDTYHFDVETEGDLTAGMSITQSGPMTGQIGYVDNNLYKFQTFTKKVGIYIIIGIVVLTFVYMFFSWMKGKEQPGGSPNMLQNRFSPPVSQKPGQKPVPVKVPASQIPTKVSGQTTHKYDAENALPVHSASQNPNLIRPDKFLPGEIHPSDTKAIAKFDAMAYSAPTDFIGNEPATLWKGVTMPARMKPLPSAPQAPDLTGAEAENARGLL